LLDDKRKSNLAFLLTRVLCEAEIAAPTLSEEETSYTARSLWPLINSELKKFSDFPLRVRGDGGDRSIPASHLGEQFFPDLSVTLEGHGVDNHIWAVEVKFLRDDSRNNSISTALGQALLYRQRYLYTAVLFVDVSSYVPGEQPISQAELQRLDDLTDSTIVVRRAMAGRLHRCEVRPLKPRS